MLGHLACDDGRVISLSQCRVFPTKAHRQACDGWRLQLNQCLVSVTEKPVAMACNETEYTKLFCVHRQFLIAWSVDMYHRENIAYESMALLLSCWYMLGL